MVHPVGQKNWADHNHRENQRVRATNAKRWSEWKKRFARWNNSRPHGALWFIEAGAKKIGRITTAGQFSEFVLPTPNYNFSGIAAGPDGALWFTALGGNKIGRITTAGEFSEFVLPAPNSRPYGITAGPDGAVWFTEKSPNESSGGKIGRIARFFIVADAGKE